MKMLVKFIAVGCKKSIANNESYIMEIYKSINSARMIKSLNLTPDEVTFGAGPLRPIDDEDNVFLLQFNSEDNGKADIWSVYFQYGTFNDSKQLEIAIYSDTYSPNVDNEYLEKLKLKIKKTIRRDWDKIIWLVDKDSECLSIALYPQIYQIENLMREVLNEVMNKQYGTTWWDTFAPTKMKETHSKRMKEFKAKVPSFNDVDEKLMCIDISDLSELMTLKRYCWKPAFDGKISGMLNGVQTYNDGIVREQLLKQREIEVDLWGEQFSKYFPDDFIERYCALARDRNHIMHNKLLDRSVYVSIKVSAERIQEDLVKALEKLHNIILSKEEKFEVEKQRQIEMQMLEELDHECRENDANVSIRNRFEIKFMFVDCLNSFVGDVEEHLRFRNDITISLDNNFRKSYMGSVMLIKSNIDDSVLELKFEMDIDDSEGADSTLSIYDTDKEFRTQLVYTNGAVEYDYDSGLYMPITQDEIGTVEEMVNDLMEVINEEIPYYKERACEEDIAEFVTCSECGDDVICINEDVLPAGTCMNCGYVNNIYQCERCSSWFNIDEGGMRDDDIAICQNCLKNMRKSNLG